MDKKVKKIFKDIQSQNDKLLENLQKLASQVIDQVIDRPTTSTIIDEKSINDIQEYKFGDNFYCSYSFRWYD